MIGSLRSHEFLKQFFSYPPLIATKVYDGHSVYLSLLFFCGLMYNWEKTEVPRDVRNSKVRKQDKFRRDWSQHKNTWKSQSGTGPGVRRSKRPLLACRTRCKCSMETTRGLFHLGIVKYTFYLSKDIVKIQYRYDHLFADTLLFNISRKQENTPSNSGVYIDST